MTNYFNINKRPLNKYLGTYYVLICVEVMIYVRSIHTWIFFIVHIIGGFALIHTWPNITISNFPKGIIKLWIDWSQNHENVHVENKGEFPAYMNMNLPIWKTYFGYFFLLFSVPLWLNYHDARVSTNQGFGFDHFDIIVLLWCMYWWCLFDVFQVGKMCGSHRVG